MKKALIPRKLYLQKMKEHFEEEKKLIDSKLQELESRLNELPRKVPACDIMRRRHDMESMRTPASWFETVKESLYHDIPIAEEIEAGEREEMGLNHSWVIDVYE